MTIPRSRSAWCWVSLPEARPIFRRGCSPTGSPPRSDGELIAYARLNPGRVNYGHLGVASTQNLLAKRLEQLTGMQMTPIPYKGTPEAMQEVVAGRTHVMVIARG